MDKIKRLCELIVQDYNGYRNCENPLALAVIKDVMVQQLAELESSLARAEELYKTLVADKSGNNDDRIRTYKLKNEMAEEVEKLKRAIGNPDAIIRKSRGIYGQTKESIDSRNEQRAITDELWGRHEKEK